MAANSSRRTRLRPCAHCRRRQRRLLLSGASILTVVASLVAWAAVSLTAPPAMATAALDLNPKLAVITASQAHVYTQQEIHTILSNEFGQPVVAIPTHKATTHQTRTPTATATPARPAYTSPSVPTPTPTVVHSATRQAPPTDGSLASRLLAEAETQRGTPYVWGGAAPGGFDCSGLVYWAALRIGISNMPRDTYSMLGQGVSSGLLIPTSNPQPGDLAFFGSGHVELYVKSGETFGAQQPGTVVDFHSYGGGWVPTAFYAIR